MEVPLTSWGTRYIMRVPTNTWNVFPYPIRGYTYPVGETVPFTPLAKINGIP